VGENTRLAGRRCRRVSALETAVCSAPTDRVCVCVCVAAPSWRRRPKSLIVAAGDTARFHCAADGLPTPTVTWLINAHDANGTYSYTQF